MNGYSRLFFEDGSYYIGQFVDNKMCGEGRYVCGNGEVKDGLF